jgi:hypothetical protein
VIKIVYSCLCQHLARHEGVDIRGRHRHVVGRVGQPKPPGQVPIVLQAARAVA